MNVRFKLHSNFFKTDSIKLCLYDCQPCGNERGALNSASYVRTKKDADLHAVKKY